MLSNKVEDFAENITDFLIENELVKIKGIPYSEKLSHPPLNGEIKMLEHLSDLLTEKELKYYGRICR
jgi:hypothetical protein